MKGQRYEVGQGGALGDEPYVYLVNFNAGSYDSPGVPVVWALKNCFTRGSDSYKAHYEHQIKFMRFIADALNKGDFDALR